MSVRSQDRRALAALIVGAISRRSGLGAPSSALEQNENHGRRSAAPVRTSGDRLATATAEARTGTGTSLANLPQSSAEVTVSVW